MAHSPKLLLSMALLLAIASSHSLVFDLRSVQYEQGSDYWNVDVPLTGGSGQYDYEFDLPSGWQSSGNRIQIPSQYIKDTGDQYVVRCRVRDSKQGSELERSLVFKPFVSGSSTSLEITDHEYYYGHSAASGSCSSCSSTVHGIDILNRLGSLTKKTSRFGGAFGSASSYGSGFSSSYGSGSSASYRNGGASSSYSFGYNSGASSSSSLSSSSSHSSSSYSSSIGSHYGSGQQSYRSLFSSLPSYSELDHYISDGDIVQIIQVIQLVVDSQLECDAKSAFLSDFLGRISAGIEIKSFALSELKEVVRVAIEQISKLTIQITSIKEQQSQLNIQKLQFQLESLIAQLKIAYEEYNTYSSDTTEYSGEIVTLETEIREIEVRFTEVQQQLTILISEVDEIDREIAEYEERIRKLRARREQSQAKIVEFKAFISQKDIRITEIKQRITVLRTKIEQSTSEREQLKQIYIAIEQQVNVLKADIEKNQRRYEEFEQQILSITVEIERYQKQTSELEIKQVTQCLENLNSAISEVRESIDFLQYNCFDVTDIEIDSCGTGKGCYHFGQNQWFGYLNKCYSNISEQIRNKVLSSFQNQVIEITTINIFSDVWKQNYGSRFDSDIKGRAKNYNGENSYSFDSDFSCSAEFQGVQESSGQIKSISSDYVSVYGDDGRDYTLKLGSCSKFEGQGKDFVPKKGQNVFWKGSRSNDAYNLHSCTCY